MSNGEFVLIVVSALAGAAAVLVTGDRNTGGIAGLLAAFFGTALVVFLLGYFLFIRVP